MVDRMVGQPSRRSAITLEAQSKPAQSRMREAVNGKVRSSVWTSTASIAIAVADDDGARRSWSRKSERRCSAVEDLKRLGRDSTVQCCYEAGRRV